METSALDCGDSDHNLPNICKLLHMDKELGKVVPNSAMR